MRTCDSAAPPTRVFSSRYSYQQRDRLTASRISRQVGSYIGLTQPRTVRIRLTATLTETDMHLRGTVTDADAMARRKVRRRAIMLGDECSRNDVTDI